MPLAARRPEDAAGSAGERRLPMAGRDPPDGADTDPSAAGRAGFVDPVDPERIRAGWEHRFVAAGARAEEMIELYRELGFEVAADPVVTAGIVEGCAACFGAGADEYRSIYTRRPTSDARIRRPSHAADSHREVPVTENHPTRVLREEHERILAVADVLEASLDEAAVSDGPSASRGAGIAADYDRLDKCIRFIRLFADACHHGKEEDMLFPALQDQGLPRDTGPIAVMLHEHRLGRSYASTMADSIEDARAGDADAWARLERAGRDYVGLIRGHILKEDNVLFNMADQLVTGPACTMLCRAYEETSDDTFGGCTKAELEELGRELVG